MTVGSISGWLRKFARRDSHPGQAGAPWMRRRSGAALAHAVGTGARWWRLESLESRTLLSMVPNNYDQYMVQLINYARSNPTSYASSLGVDLNEGIAAGTISSTAKQPLAINTSLVQSATGHSQWMLDTGTFSHTGSGGSAPNNRMSAAGYTFSGSYTWGENIAWGGTTGAAYNTGTETKSLEQDLFTDLTETGRGHRINLMTDSFREVGVGVLTGTFQSYKAVMITQDFAASGTRYFLTGAVYDDRLVSRDTFYNPGEGLGGVTITAVNGNASYQTTTWDSGGYNLSLPAGTYHVTVQGGSFSGTAATDVTIASRNVEADFISGNAYASINFSAFAPADTSINVVASSGTITYGQSVTLTATISSGAGRPSGTITFYDGSIGLGTATINTNTGVATFSRASFTAGTHYVQASYGGNSTFAAGTSSAYTLTVNQAPLSVTALSQSRTYGQVNPILNGIVTGVLGSDGITATYSTNASTFSHPGGYPITGALRDPNGKLANYAVTNNPSTLTIAKANQVITWSTPAALMFGTPLSTVQLNATAAGVAGGSAPGALTYNPDAGALLDVGSHTLTVSAAGTTDYNGASKTVTLTVTLPDKPVNISPVNGAVSLSLTPSLAVSHYSIPAGVTQLASQWLVTRVADGATVWDSGPDTADTLTVAVPADTLDHLTQYAWQFRYQDTAGSWSAYSTATTFTTWDGSPNTPTNTVPADSATGVSLTPALSASAYTTMSTNAQAASQWVVTRASDNVIIWDSGTHSAALATVAIPAGKLAYDASYDWQVRYLDSGGLWSGFSTPTAFHTVAAHLRVTQQPRGAIIATPNATDLVIAVVDESNHVITADNSTITLTVASKPRGGVVSGDLALAVVDGVARFSNLLFSTTGTYTLQAADGDLAAITSAAISVTLPPAKLAFVQQPATTVAGHTIGTTTHTALLVAVLDAKGRIVAADASSVTISLNQLSGTLNGTLTAPVIDGIATFSNLTITKTGKYSLKVTDGILKAASSKSFTVTPDLTTAHLEWAQQPNATLVGKALSPRPVVQTVDQYDNLVTSDRSLILLASSTGTFTGTSAARLSGGRATFSNVIFRTAGDYTLTATPETSSTLAVTTPISTNVAIAQGTTNPITVPAFKTTYIFGKALTFSVRLTANTPSSILFTSTPTLVITGAEKLSIPATSLASTGNAKFTIPVLPPGVYTCQVVYAGEVNHSGAVSVPFSFTVNQVATTTVLAATPTRLAAGQSLTLSAVVKTSAAPGIARTGTVQFLDNGIPFQTLSLNASSSASIVLTPTATGNHVYQAIYLGDSDFTGSQSSLLNRLIL